MVSLEVMAYTKARPADVAIRQAWIITSLATFLTQVKTAILVHTRRIWFCPHPFDLFVGSTVANRL